MGSAQSSEVTSGPAGPVGPQGQKGLRGPRGGPGADGKDFVCDAQCFERVKAGVYEKLRNDGYNQYLTLGDGDDRVVMHVSELAELKAMASEDHVGIYHHLNDDPLPRLCVRNADVDSPYEICVDRRHLEMLKDVYTNNLDAPGARFAPYDHNHNDLYSLQTEHRVLAGKVNSLTENANTLAAGVKAQEELNKKHAGTLDAHNRQLAKLNDTLFTHAQKQDKHLAAMAKVCAVGKPVSCQRIQPLLEDAGTCSCGKTASADRMCDYDNGTKLCALGYEPTMCVLDALPGEGPLEDPSALRFEVRPSLTAEFVARGMHEFNCSSGPGP